jgi:hypothetical protein
VTEESELTDAERYGVCSKGGHPWSPENTLWESSGRKDGRKRRRCRQCRKDKRAEAAANAAKGFPSSASSQARRGRGVPDRPFNVQRALVDFDYALKHVRPHCRGNTREFTDWELEDAPSPETAARLCEPCVLKQLCLERAEAESPYWGVWGAKVWIEGSIYEEGTA